MKHLIKCRETGDVIEHGLSKEDAEDIVRMYEAEDKENGDFEENFYEIVPYVYCLVSAESIDSKNFTIHSVHEDNCDPGTLGEHGSYLFKNGCVKHEGRYYFMQKYTVNV